MDNRMLNGDGLPQNVRDALRRDLRSAEYHLVRGHRHERAAGRLLAAAALMMDGFSGPARNFVAEAWEELGQARELVEFLRGKLMVDG